MRRMDREQLSTDPRVTVRCSGQPAYDGTAVVYWMQRAQRASDNPALETAIVAANALGKPVVVYFALIAGAAGANLRHYHFMVQGLHDVAEDLPRRGIGFVVRRSPDHEVLRFCDEVRPALVIGDENPLRRSEQAKQRLAAALRVPFWTVDADVIVPSRLLQKEQYAARTIRPCIHAQLPHFLRPIRRPVPRHTWTRPRRLPTLHPDLRLLDGFPIDRSVSPVAACRAGSHAARGVLRRFVAERLSGYAKHRNHPERDATSQLSPYLHFGHIGPQTVALAVRDADAPARDREAFLEELIVRREPVEETVWARWGRRAVTVPLYLLLGTLTVALLPVTITLALASDAVRQTGHLITLRCTLAITLYFTCEALGIVASFVLWVATGLWPGATAERVLTWNLLLQRLWARTLFTGATRLFSMCVGVTGEEAVRRGPLFLLSRHASTLDTLLPAVFASQPDTLRLGHVMKRELLWDPCLAIVGQRLHPPWLRRARQGDCAAAPAGYGSYRARRGVAVPRGDAVLASEARARPDVDVAFLAHVGFEGTASLNDIWRGKLIGRTIQLCFWRVPSAAIPMTASPRSAPDRAVSICPDID